METMLYTVSEVAAILKCNPNMVHKLRKSGLLPFLKLGYYKCRREALEEFLRKHEGYDVTDPYDVITLEESEERERQKREAEKEEKKNRKKEKRKEKQPPKSEESAAVENDIGCDEIDGDMCDRVFGTSEDATS